MAEARNGRGALQSLAVTLAVVGFGLAWAAVEKRVVARGSEPPPAPIAIGFQEWELALARPIAEDWSDPPPQRRPGQDHDHSQPRPSHELPRAGAHRDGRGS